jgi:predicted nucleic acid-binding protein
MMIGAGDPTFVDTNIMVFATVEDAPLYPIARQTLEQLWLNRSELWISRQVIREYLAVLTRPQTYAIRLTRDEILAAVRGLLTRFRIAEDSALVTNELLRILERVPVGGRQIHDANIVATMRAHEVGRLLTHNPDDFDRFAGLINVVPLVRP